MQAGTWWTSLNSQPSALSPNPCTLNPKPRTLNLKRLLSTAAWHPVSSRCRGAAAGCKGLLQRRRGALHRRRLLRSHVAYGSQGQRRGQPHLARARPPLRLVLMFLRLMWTRPCAGRKSTQERARKNGPARTGPQERAFLATWAACIFGRVRGRSGVKGLWCRTLLLATWARCIYSGLPACGQSCGQ